MFKMGIKVKTGAAFLTSALLIVGGSAISYADGAVNQITVKFGNESNIKNGNSYTVGNNNSVIKLPSEGSNTIEVGSVHDKDYTNTMNTFRLDSEEYSITVGHQFELEAFYSNALGHTSNVSKQAIFFSSNPNVVNVDSNGMMTGINPGFTHVTAIYQGQIYTSSVLVVRPYVRPS